MIFSSFTINKDFERFVLTIFLVLFCQLNSARNQVDTINVYSPKMKKEIKNVVILPANYSKKKHYPVVYLLHGYSGNYTDWVRLVPTIKTYSTNYQFIIVCPDGGYNSFYFDSPIDSTSQYETYISQDLIVTIDNKYSTIPNRNARAITGLSMGGHGALYLAIRHQDIFSNAGCMSGVVDLRYSTQKKGLANRIGNFETDSLEWKKRSVTNLIDSIKNNELNLIIDCGNADAFSQITLKLHNKLLVQKIDHDYIERPGAHTWDYWANAIPHQLLFFDTCFHKKLKM